MRLALILAIAATPLLIVPVYADCTSDIEDLLVRANTSGPYRLETVVTSATGAMDMSMSAAMVPPSAMHSTTVTGGQTIEMVFTDGKGWMNMAGAWSELPPEAASEMTKVFDPEFIKSMGTIQNPRCLGTVTIQGKELLAYEYEFAMQGISSESKLFVDPATNLPVRAEGTAEIGGTATETVATYTYDPTLTVTAPSF